MGRTMSVETADGGALVEARPKRKSVSSVRGGLSLTRTTVLLAPITILLAVAFVYPLFDLLIRSFGEQEWTLANYVRVFDENLYLAIIFRTLRVAGVAALCCLVLGFPVALYLARLSGWMLAIGMALVLLPLWTNILVRTYAWTVILQRQGLLNWFFQTVGITDQPLPLLYNEVAMMVAMSQVLLPFMILPLYASLRNIPAEVYRAARNMGSGPVRTFLKITLPLSSAGALAGTTLVFIIAMGFYVTPALIGGPRSMTAGPLIYQQVIEQANWPFGAALASVLLAVTMLLLGVMRMLTRGSS